MNEFNEQVFGPAAKWKCEHTGCDQPATQVIEWRHQDGDRERRILCREHVIKDQECWSAMDWDVRAALLSRNRRFGARLPK